MLLAQQGLLAFIEAFIERLVTAERAGECTGEIEALSLAILTSSLAGAVKVEGGSKAVDFALIVKLLGSTKPTNNRATKSSKSGAGHWGTITGPKATSDIETAMMNLGTILLAIRVKALGEDGGTREDYGMHDLARDTLGELNIVKATELFEDLFQRADRGARHQRSRAYALEVGWASLIEVDMREKLEALGREEHSEEAGARGGRQAAAEALGAGNKHKVPLTNPEGDAKVPRSERRRLEYAAKLEAVKAGGTPAAMSTTATATAAAAAATAAAAAAAVATAATAGRAWVPSFAANSITMLIDKKTKRLGAVEHFDYLLRLAHPHLSNAQLPCAFAAFACGCKGGVIGSPPCRSCTTQADMAKKAGGAPAVPPGTLDKVRAACVASLQTKI